MKLSRADRAINGVLSVVSPKRANMRLHFLRMKGDTEYRDLIFSVMSARGYRAAHQSGSKTPWTGGTQSADQEISTDLPTLRNRARELNRDDSLGSGLTLSFTNNVIGTGMRAQARTGDSEKNKRIEAVWDLRKDSLSPTDVLSHGEAQRLIFRKVFEDGDVVRKIATSSPDEPIWFETIEADRLMTPASKVSQANIRDGVERDSAGRPKTYWIRSAQNNGILTATDFTAKGYSADIVRHLKITERPGQTRGVPQFHAILQDIRDLDLLMLASLKRVQIAACLAAFIKSPDPATDFMSATATKYGLQMDESIVPGMIWKLYPGEEIQSFIPNFPTPELEPFVIMLARRIGAALGISWQIVLKDFSKSTYSSARTDLLESRATFVFFQHWFIEKYLNWEWFQVLKDAQMRGLGDLDGLTDEDLHAVQWIPNGWRWIDPEKEAKAAKIELEVGTTTKQILCASKGLDWELVQDQLLIEEKREIDRRIELGLPPRQASPDDDPTPEPPDETGDEANANSNSED